MPQAKKHDSLDALSEVFLQKMQKNQPKKDLKIMLELKSAEPKNIKVLEDNGLNIKSQSKKRVFGVVSLENIEKIKKLDCVSDIEVSHKLGLH